MAMIVTLGTTGTTPDPSPVNLAPDEALIVNAGAYRVVIQESGMHVIDDREGDTVFEWPIHD